MILEEEARTDRRPRLWLRIGIAAIVLLVAAYVGSPFISLLQLKGALHEGRVAELERLIDFPAV